MIEKLDEEYLTLKHRLNSTAKLRHLIYFKTQSLGVGFINCHRFAPKVFMIRHALPLNYGFDPDI